MTRDETFELWLRRWGCFTPQQIGLLMGAYRRKGEVYATALAKGVRADQLAAEDEKRAKATV